MIDRRRVSTGAVARSWAVSAGLLLTIVWLPGAPLLAQSAPPPAPATTDTWLARQFNALKDWFAPGQERGAHQGAPPGQKGGTPPPAAVSVSRPIVREIIEWDEYTARFEPVEMVEVRARVAGYLAQVHFTDGQSVKAGDPLYTIDPRPFERTLETARAELELARTRVANAAKDVERGRPLVERRVISDKVFDDRENVVRDAEAAAKVAEARIKAAELELSFTRMTAPIAGRVSRSSVTAGNYVTAGGSNNATVLTTIVRQDPVHLYFDVSENHTLKYKRLVQAGQRAGATAVGAQVQVALPDEQGFPHQGQLDFSDNRLDSGTGTLRVRAVLDNRDGLFSAGMFARVRIAGSPRQVALLLPDEAIGTDQSAKFVYVVGDDGMAVRKTVVVGPIAEAMRVVRAGITAEDWVIIKGVQRTRPGQKLAPKREPLQLSSAPVGAAPTAKE